MSLISQEKKGTIDKTGNVDLNLPIAVAAVQQNLTKEKGYESGNGKRTN